MMHARQHCLAVCLCLGMAACGGGGSSPAASTSSARVTDAGGVTATGVGRAVVAVIDTGTNPYHEAFHAGGSLYRATAPSAVTPALLAAFGIGESHILRLSRSGDFARDVAADAAQWARVRRGEPYWVAGTNLILVSFAPAGVTPLKPDAGKDPHGVGTSAALLASAPQSVVVVVEGENADGEAWAFSHPAVDIVSTSYGTPGSVPLLSAALNQSFEGVVRRGKLHVGASDNSPALTPFDGTAGPWWVMGVAGFEDDAQGRQLVSGNLPDFLADFTQDLPYCMDCESGLSTVGGTSFSTPRAAGVAAQLLRLARDRLGDGGGISAGAGGPVMARGGGREISVWQLRRALEQAAILPSATDYQPGDPASVPVAPLLPALQTGWGVLAPDAGLYQRGLAALSGGEVQAQTAPGTCELQTVVMRLRQRYWNDINPTSPSAGFSDPSPLIACDTPLSALP